VGDRLEVSAPAKVNLTLEVLGRRDDGFHELASLVHTVSLADTLTFEPADAFRCEVAGLALSDEENLVLRAARLIGERAGGRGARITLTKRIPAAAGLGGGSSDAAATLRALDRLWGLGLTDLELSAMAAELGSDVPLFLGNGSAVLRGRGEILEPAPVIQEQWLVLLVSEHAVARKTVELYRRMKPDLYTRGDATEQARRRLGAGKLSDEDLFNVFTPLALEVFPGLGDLRGTAERLVGRRFHLTGAGPALFALQDSRREAEEAAERLRSTGGQSFAVTLRGL